MAHPPNHVIYHHQISIDTTTKNLLPSSTLSDVNLSRLENRVNTQLQYIAQWLNQNKLTLNYFKATYRYLLFNKQLHGPISSKFSLQINQKEISTSESVKYLSVWFDDKLNWSAHIQKLSLQLARCCNMA